MDFAEVPLPVLIKKFRSECPEFTTVKSAAFTFLKYLDAFGKRGPVSTKESQIRKIVEPIIDRISKRYSYKFEELITNPPQSSIKTAADFRNASVTLITEFIEFYEKLVTSRPNANFVGNGRLRSRP